MKTNSLPKNENESCRKLDNITLTNEMIEEIWEQQGNNNSALNRDIERIDEVIEYMTALHMYKEEAISADKIMDCVCTLRWITERIKVFRAPAPSVSE